VGPNGAGKSTVVRLLLGVIAPSAGRVLVDGCEPHRTPPRRLARVLAAVAQEEPLEFPFTVEEVVLMGRAARLGPLGFERAEDLAAAAATGVADLAHRPLHELSGGERKRVLVARALAQEAPHLVLDEPAAALDVHHQVAIFDLLAARSRDGATVVVVVHDLNLAAAYCDRLLLLRPPRQGPPVVGAAAEVLTEERLRDAFGVDVYVGENARTGDRLIVPMSPSRRRRG
jgi:iron complex transport system ATP-binding protein